MNETRLAAEQLNRLLLLHILNLCQSNRMDGSTRFQKIVFMTQFTVRRLARKMRGFNYPFVRWNYGPYSAKLAEDIEILRSMGLITKQIGAPTYFFLTEKGKSYIEQYPLEKIVDLEVADVIKQYVQKYDTMGLHRILDEVYETVNLNETYQMGETIMAFDELEDIEKSELIKKGLEAYLSLERRK